MKGRANDPKEVSPIVGKDTTAPRDQKVADAASNTREPGASADAGFLKPDNWDGLKDLWTINGTTIVGEAKTDRQFNTFFFTKQKYKDFEMSFQVRLKNGVGNSGVQIRSTVVDSAKFAVAGPQADIGARRLGQPLRRAVHQRR